MCGQATCCNSQACKNCTLAATYMIRHSRLVTPWQGNRRSYTLVAPGRCVYPDKGSVELNELPIFTVYRLVLQQVLLCLDVKADHFVQLQMHPAS